MIADASPRPLSAAFSPWRRTYGGHGISNNSVFEIMKMGFLHLSVLIISSIKYSQLFALRPLVVQQYSALTSLIIDAIMLNHSAVLKIYGIFDTFCTAGRYKLLRW